MAQNSVKQLLEKSVSIPTLPQIVMQINQLVADPDSGTREIGSLVAQDGPLATKVLGIANSSFYGLRNECVSTEQATTVLGVKVLRSIVTQISVMSQFAHLESVEGFSIEKLWEHANLAAHACSKIAAKCKRATDIDPPEFYVCGLLHDIGKIVMLDGLGDEYISVVLASQARDVPVHVVEEEAFGFDHTNVGYSVAKRWALPNAVADAILYHHGPKEQLQRDPNIALVACADKLVHGVTDEDPQAAESAFDEVTMGLLGLEAQDVASVAEFLAANDGSI